jgi:hypothetical protein
MVKVTEIETPSRPYSKSISERLSDSFADSAKGLNIA